MSEQNPAPSPEPPAPGMTPEPDTLAVDYRNTMLVFTRMAGVGWHFTCPGGCCRAQHWIDTDSGTMHRITSAPGEPVTIAGSLGCNCKGKGTPEGCKWHVMIENGVARDA